MSSWRQFKSEWNNCDLCSLHKQRTKMVFARGVVPCDFLFIGEAPGVSEDNLGQAFIGPAGKIQDAMIKEAQNTSTIARDEKIKLCFTNLVCCIPKNASGRKVTEPPEESIKACQPRLQQFLHLCKPSVIVEVGSLAKKWLPKLIAGYREYKTISVVHPAAILRAEVYRQGLMQQESIVTLRDAFEEFVVPF